MIENNDFTSSREWLKNIIQRKMNNNPAYSIRAFSKHIGLSPSYITRVLKGTRSLTIKSSLKICDIFSSTPQERAKIFSIISKEAGIITDKEKNVVSQEEANLNLSVDTFCIISDWYHYAISQLFNLEDFKDDQKWISRKLGISVLEVKMALERMEKLGVIKRNKKNQLVKTSKTLSTTDGVYSAGLRNFHKQILNKAIDAIEEVSIEERSITSITMAINEEKLEAAKKEIAKFRKKMSRFLEKGKKTRVYNLNINLIPLSKKVTEEQ